MLVLCNLIIVACHIAAVMSAPATYDQRQTGDLNVQIDLKDVHIVALVNSELLEDYTDYDYFYDYADFTIKPSGRPTTPSPIETTDNSNITNVVEPASSQNSTISASPDNTKNSTEFEKVPDISSSNGTTSNSTSSADDNDKNRSSEENGSTELAVVASSITTASSSITSSPVQALRSRKRCKSGYIPDGSGRCRRAHRRWLSLLS